MKNLTPEQLEKRKSINKKILTFVMLPAIILFVFAFFADGDKEKENIDHGEKYTKVGYWLKTRYFDVSVDSVYTDSELNTGNKYTSLPQEKGQRYIFLQVTYKNTSDESRMITDGEIIVNFNNKEYRFDKAESVHEDGYGFNIATINPLSEKTAIVVYKIPSEATGKAYYRPGRSDKEDRISIGYL